MDDVWMRNMEHVSDRVSKIFMLAIEPKVIPRSLVNRIARN